MKDEARQISRWRAAFAEPDPAPDPASCPTAETLWSAVRGELSAEEMGAVLDHVASCAACAEDWRLAAELSRQEERASQGPDKVVLGRFGQWRPLAAVAALAACLAVAVGVYRVNHPVEAPVYRDVHHAGISSLLPQGAALPRDAATLRWSPLAGAVAYDVEVSTEDLRTVATAKGQATTEYHIPESALAALPAGTRLLWQVEAVRPDGTHESSPTFITPLQ